MIQETANQLRSLLVEQVSIIQDETVGLFLSAGLDSTSLGFAAMQAGKKVDAYTFKVKGIPSTDADGARATASRFGWKFTCFVIDPINYHNDMQVLRDRFKCETKTQFECCWPFLKMMRSGHGFAKHILSGVAADGHFGLSKKAMIHFRYPKAKFDHFRQAYFAKSNPAGYQNMKRIVSTYGSELVAPYLDPRVYSILINLSWDQLNKPKQKNITRLAFSSDFAKIKTRKHENLQLVSGVSNVFKSLVKSPLNNRNRSRTLDVIRDFVRNKQ